MEKRREVFRDEMKVYHKVQYILVQDIFCVLYRNL